MRKQKFFGTAWLTLFVLMLLSGCLASCSTARHVQKDTTTVTSDSDRSLADSVHKLSEINAQLKDENKELRNAYVLFESAKCPEIPPVIIPAECKDSALIRAVYEANERTRLANQVITGLNRKVKVLTDGSIEAEGNISSVRSQSDITHALLIQSNQRIDSFAKALQVEKTRSTVKSDTKTKDSKTKFLGQWWLFPAGFLCCLLLVYRRKFFPSP